MNEDHVYAISAGLTIFMFLIGIEINASYFPSMSLFLTLPIIIGLCFLVAYLSDRIFLPFANKILDNKILGVQSR